MIIGKRFKRNESTEDRSREIISISESCTVFLKFVADGQEISQVDESFSHCLDYEFYRGRTLKRIKRGDDFLNAFSINMTSSEMYKPNYGNRIDLNYVELEEKMESSKEMMELTSDYRSTNDDMIELLIDGVMPNSSESINSDGKPNVKKYLTEQLRKTHSEISWRRISQLVSIHQEVAQCVLMSSKLAKSRKGHCVFFSNVSDRAAICFNTLTFSTSQLNDTTCCIHGMLDTDNGFLVKPTRTAMSTDWFNLSPPMLNWYSCVYMKYMSYSSQYFETALANTSRPISTYEIAMLMLINRSGFSQASESIRYLFVNSTGIRKTLRGLFKSFDFHEDGFYKPSSHVEKLLFLRVLKTFPCIKLISNSNLKAELLNNYVARNETTTNLSHTKFTHWNIAFPHETYSIPSEQNVYNSLYICRLLTMERNNKLLDETLVMQKSIDAHMNFLENRKRIGRDSASAVVDVEQNFMDLDINGPYGLYNPNILVVAVAVLNSELESNDMSFSETVESKYSMESSIFRLSISDVMNNKGSTCSVGGFVQKTEFDGKKMRGSQSSKCYKTTMENVQSFMDNSDSMTHYNPSTLLHSPTSLMPVLLHNTRHNFPFVARMFPKGEIGPREIAILNSPMRVSSFFIESIARLQRHSEHSRNDTTNLIEEKKKDSIVNLMHKKFTKEKSYFFDNADCSKWGPSQLSYVLYLVLASRVNCKNIRRLIRHQLKLFSKKVIKFPDGIVKNLSKVGIGNNQITKLINFLNSSDVVNLEGRYMESPEGMFQGVLGNTSSILASDCLRLSTSMIKIIHKLEYDSSVELECHATSDDVVRAVSFDGNKMNAMTAISIDNIVVNKISGLCGIKRNEYKSTYSQHVCEFNSVFLTKEGEYSADVKSRLSFVEYSQNYDILEASVRCETQSSEYLRREGSIMGSIWVDLLNKCLYLHQFQLVDFFLRDPIKLYEIPLELGGMIRIDPISSCFDPTTDIRRSNYINFSIMPDIASVFSETEKYEEFGVDENKSLSRSVVYNVKKKKSARSLSLSKFLSELPNSYFLPLINNVKTPISFLVSNDQREQSSTDRKENGLRFLQVQAPLSSEIFHVRNGPYRKWLNENVGEKAYYNRMDINELRNSVDLRIDRHIQPRLADSIRSMSRGGRLQTYLDYVYIDKIVPLSRNIELRRDSMTFMEHENTKALEDEMLETIKPVILGGKSKMSLRVYLMNQIMIKTKISKITSRTQKFKISNIPNDNTNDIVDSILKSNLVEGGKAQYFIERSIDNLSADPTNHYIMVLSSSHFRYRAGSQRTVDIIGNRSEPSSSIDITKIISYINSNWTHHDPSERKLLVMALLNFQKTVRHKLVVNHDELIKLKKDYCSTIKGGLLNLYYYPKRDKNDNVSSSDFIVKTNDSYRHHVTVYDDALTQKDTQHDKYNYKRELSGYVRIVNFRGITMLASDEGDKKNWFLQPIYTGDILESKEVSLSCKETEILISNNDKLKLRLLTNEFSVKTEFKMTKKYNDIIADELVSKSEYRDVLLEKNLFEAEDMLVDHGIPDDVFMDIELVPDDNPDEDSDTDSWADDFEEPDEYFPDHLSITSSFTSDSIKKFPQLDGVDKITIRLPKELKNQYVTDSMSGITAVGKLLNDISMLEDEFEKFWSLSTLSQLVTKKNFS
jgi:hypothetical protein